MSRGRSLPLTQGESAWVAVAAGVTIMTVLMLLVGPNIQHFVTRPTVPSPPVHSALPDLCTVFPGGAAGGLTLRPDLSSRVLDRSEAACAYAVAGKGRERGGSVRIEAERPEPMGLNVGRSGELEAARRAFRDRSGPPAGGPFHRWPGQGDEAGFATEVREYATATTVLIRDGVLLIRVRYEALGGGAEESRTAPATVQETARRIAVELRARLPKEGG